MLYHERLGHDCKQWCCGFPVPHIRNLIPGFLQIIALSGGVGMRLFGISVASFSSGPFNRAFTCPWLKIPTSLA